MRYSHAWAAALLTFSMLHVCNGFLASHVQTFVPSVPRHTLRHARRGAQRGVCAELRMMAGGKDDDEVVEVSVEELRSLAEKAGIKVQIAKNAPRQPQQQFAQPFDGGVFTPFLQAIKPLRSLPPIIQYPILLGLIGIVSSIFLPLFGSASLGDMTGANNKAAEQAVVAQEKQTDKEASEMAKPSGLSFKATAPPPEEMTINRSCDKWPWNLTPTCTDPSIGEKGILKNLDKYSTVNPKVLQMRAESDARKAAAESARQAADK